MVFIVISSMFVINGFRNPFRYISPQACVRNILFVPTLLSRSRLHCIVDNLNLNGTKVYGPAFANNQNEKVDLHNNTTGDGIYSSLPQEDDEWDPSCASKMDFDECYYKVLEVTYDVPSKVLKKAYKSMVFTYHPDRRKAEEKVLANRQLMVINGAYRVLANPETRKSYDDALKAGYVGSRAGVKGSGRNPPTKGAQANANYDGNYDPGRSSTMNDVQSSSRRKYYYNDWETWYTNWEKAQVNKQPRRTITEDDLNFEFDDDMDIDDILGWSRQRKATPESTYYRRSQPSSAYEWEDFARTEPPTTPYNGYKKESLNDNAVDNDIDDTQERKNNNSQESETLESGFISVSYPDENSIDDSKRRNVDGGDKTENGLDDFFTDAYNQLENQSVKGPLGEVTIALRVLLGLIVNRNGDK